MRFILVAAVVIFAVISNSFASPRYTAARQAAERVKKDEKDLKDKIKRLSSTEKGMLKRRFRGQDSDSDGLPDILEDGLGSKTCDSDSDDDGLDDSDDEAENNRDSDGDGREDGVEVNAKGAVISFVDPTLLVAGKRFTLTGSTVFLGSGFTKDSLEAGLCIEVEGHSSGADLVADKIKRDDDC